MVQEHDTRGPFEAFLPGIRKALAMGGDTHTVEDVLNQILSGDAQLWCDDDALIVTEVRQTPRKRLLHFWLATGSLRPVIRLSDRICEWGKQVGCDTATFVGRQAWTRAVRRHGWSPSVVHYERSLNNGQRRR